MSNANFISVWQSLGTSQSQFDSDEFTFLHNVRLQPGYFTLACDI